MEKYALSDTGLRKDYGFRDLTVGVEPIEKMLQPDTLGVYAEPPAEWTSSPPSEPVYYEIEYHTLVGKFHLATSKYSLGLDFATNFTYSFLVQLAAFMLPTARLSGRGGFEFPPLVSRKETNVLESLIDNGRHDVAQGLDSLIRQIADNPDDFDPVQQESLESLVKYFVTHDTPYSPFGYVVATADGILGVEWRLPPTQPTNNQWRNSDGILSLRFLPSGDIVFAGETRPTESEAEFYDFGEEPHSVVSDRIAPFFNMLRLIDADQ